MVARLERLPRKTISKEGTLYDEQWLQHLVHAHPELLPVIEIEPAFEPAIAVCIELPTPKGYIDNFFVTPTGNLLLAEWKLWRNPEARRQVVAQVMDYVESITSWGYVDLEDAVRRAQLPAGGRPRRRDSTTSSAGTRSSTKPNSSTPCRATSVSGEAFSSSWGMEAGKRPSL